MMGLFQSVILKKYLSVGNDKIAAAYGLYFQYFHHPDIQENIRNSKEEQFQEGFLRKLFVEILGYTLYPEPDYNLITEKKNEKDARKADGAILVNGEVKAVIELKDYKTTDLKQVETQAFGYKNNHRKASYVVISTFEKLRFYIENTIDYEEFNLFALSEDDFAVLWICLAYENIAADLPKRLKNESTDNEDRITKQLYKEYTAFRHALFSDMLANNKGFKPLALFKKTQKLLDRLLFILFAEDCGLLPPNSIVEIIKQWETLKELDEYKPLYDRLKKYFGYMNTGHKGKKHDVFAYNGGLFLPDEVLDIIQISDEALCPHLLTLSRYDFSSEVDVNILGHIFEHSLTEIESITRGHAMTRGHDPLLLSKRKKDGVFYTPRYITAYIVENTVGKLCADKKTELEIDEQAYIADKKRPKSQTKQLSDKLNTYRQWLLSLTICDPACGSGAFLNAALDFLMTEHRYIDELDTKLSGGGIVFPNIENAILENNLYGVDINEESVEIAKLALWLRTAKPHRKLNSLNNNIKCGNSLIASGHEMTRGHDPLLYKSFDWHKEFPQVFTEKDKKAFHVTTATHDSRTSQRMIDYNVRKMRFNTSKGFKPLVSKPRILTDEEEIIITKTICEIVKEDELNVLAYNICRDHIHMLLVCEEEELYKIVKKIKGKTARVLNVVTNKGVNKGFKPLAMIDEKCPTPLWTQKFGYKEITGREQLYNTIEYIENNRIKHDLPENSKGFKPLATIDHAFRPEYKGGFDVVIGNPPYVHLENIRNESEKLSKQNYQTYDKRGDLYALFVEKGFSVLKKGGYISYIMPNKWLQAGYGKSLRAYLLTKKLVRLIDFGDIQIFEGATTYPCIFIAQNEDSITKPFKVSVLSSFLITDFFAAVKQTEEEFDAGKLTSDTWVISSQKDSQLLERLKNENSTLEKFIKGEAYYGIKTGLTEAFLIDQSVKEQIIGATPKAIEIIKPFLQGRDIKKYATATENRYLILFAKGFTNSTTLFSNESEAWNWIANKYPLISKWLEPFSDKGKNRTDKGDYWWELRACDYYDVFAKPKIMYQKFQVKPCFIFDESGLYCNDSMWIIPTESKALLAILNSKMGWWLISKYCTQIQNGYQLIWKYFGQIPIPQMLTAELDTLADQMLTLNYDLQTKRKRFLKRLSDNSAVPTDKGACPLAINNAPVTTNKGFKPLVITNTLAYFDELEFAQFLAELKKQKITLSLNQQDEWDDYFNTCKIACRNLVNQINTTDSEIDKLVYALYGLTGDEIKIIEK